MEPKMARTEAEQLQKMTKWKSEPTVKMLKDDFMIAKPAHDAQVVNIRRWRDLKNVKGAARPKTAKNRSRVQPKVIRRQAEWRYSALSETFLASPKLFKIDPVTFEDAEAARQNSLLIEHQFRTKLNRVKFFDELVRATVDDGTSCLRLGWRRETRKVQKEVPVWSYVENQDPEFLAQLEQATALQEQNPRGFNALPDEVIESVLGTQEFGKPVMAVQTGTQMVEEDEIIRNHPTIELIDYDNVYIDPFCEGDISKAKFVIISFETSKAELAKDGRYKNLKLVNWDSNTPLHDPEHAAAGDHSLGFTDEPRKRVVAYEYYGFRDVNGDGKLVPIVATWVGDTLIRMEENPYPDEEAPLVLIPYLPVVKSPTGETDAELLEDNQAIIGAVTRGMIDLMGRAANGQTGFAKGLLDPLNRKRYDNGEDYDFNPVVPINQGVYNHTFPEIPASALNMLTMQNQEAEALSGVKAFSGGLSGEAYGDVAAAIRGMLDASSKREMGIIRRIAEGMAQVARKIIKMNQIFLTDEEVVRVTNDPKIAIRDQKPTDEFTFATVKREDLMGEFDITVDINTPEIEESQARDLTFMLQTMGNSIPFELTQIILADIARLKRMPELSHGIKSFQPQPDPVAQKRQELEIKKLELEIAEIESKIALNKAKAVGELADADKTNLDFLEQETGTAHARDIDKVQAQARSNEQLEITKAILSEKPEEGSRNKVAEAVRQREFSGALTQ